MRTNRFEMTKRAAAWISFLMLLMYAASHGSAQQGYFRVEQRAGVWWLIDPEGRETLSMGVNHIRFEPDKIRGAGPSLYREAVEKIYPDRNTWGMASLVRLRTWGFNTIGAWSEEDLWNHGVPYTVILDIAAQAGADWQHGKPVDVYDPRFEETAREIATKMCAPRAQDHSLLGYFSDNELRWGPDWRGKETMLEMYLRLPAGAAGREEAVRFLRERYGSDIMRLNTEWGTNVTDFGAAMPGRTTDAFQADADEFLERVATRYFEVCSRAIKALDPNHLYLGARFAGQVPDPVMRAARLVDVVSVNIYDYDPRPKARKVIELSGRPILIGEFAFRGQDVGLPNSRGAGPKVPNQEARAKAFSDYVNWLMSLPEAVGYHWFQWSDEPKEGRFDGEDSNYGVVDTHDKAYDVLVETMKAVNANALEAHRKSSTTATK